MLVTPIVFWAVRDVITDNPYVWSARKVLRSACMPAPPLGSLPAIVRTRGTKGLSDA